MAAPRKPIAIAGGGIGGLATALALSRKGLASTVFERRDAASEDGAGIQIGPNGTRVLSALGVADSLAPVVARPDALSLRDGMSAREIARLPLGQFTEQRYGAPYWTLHRADLHRALRERAEADPLIEMRAGIALADFRETAAGIALSGTGDAGARDYAALIAADGLWSSLRAKISGASVEPQPLGKSAYRSVIAMDRIPADLRSNAVHLWLSPRVHAVHYPVNGGRDLAIVVIADDAQSQRSWSVPVADVAITSAITAFAPVFKELAAAAPSWRQWSLHHLAPLPVWGRGRATLLGDAAHPVLPFLAQGGVLALEDAIALARHVASDPERIADGLRAYEQERRPRVARVARASRRNGRIYQLGGAAAKARDSVLRSVPAKTLMSQFDWLYGFDVTAPERVASERAPSRPIAARVTLGAQAVTIDGQNRVLLVRHGYRPGWHFPGGGVERGEPLEQALNRELLEETGVAVDGPVELVGVYTNFDAFPGDHVALFLVKNWRRDHTPQPNAEIAEHRFFALDQLPENLAAGTGRRLRELFQNAPAARSW